MKVLHINHSDIYGGAARAAYRIHHALRDLGLASSMYVNVAASGDWTVQGPPLKCDKIAVRAKPFIAGFLCKSMSTENSIIHSPAIFRSSWLKHINASNADIVHLHWLQHEMLSISDIGKLRKPVVWTLHDMWGFCGAEHYTTDERWREGYFKNNRPNYEAGFDINRWTWERKRKHWNTPMQIVAPSNWLADCVRGSALMHDWPVAVIPNCLDTDKWRPIPQDLARQILGFPVDAPILLFGAMGGGSDARKGFDLLESALNIARTKIPRLELIIFGECSPNNPPDLGFPVHYTGHLYDDISLRTIYSAADAIVVPSRQEVFGQTASEANACGTPVICFDVGGLSDIVVHRKNGFLAIPFDVMDLARGLIWAVQENDKQKVRELTRAHAELHFSSRLVAKRYLEIYKNVISK
ncbi:glycosyltransferase [Rhodobacterales bacterium FZCC0069]|nr:glycosyltransferase [Rhodobacterales bacterium FZCC0069]